MILPDANLLLYSVNCDSPDHTAAFAWLQRLLQSGQPVGLYTGVAFAFLRLSTNRRVFTNPLQVAEGFAYLNNWLSFPMVALIDAEREDLAFCEQRRTPALLPGADPREAPPSAGLGKGTMLNSLILNASLIRTHKTRPASRLLDIASAVRNRLQARLPLGSRSRSSIMSLSNDEALIRTCPTRPIPQPFRSGFKTWV